jgi:hypothetical protein
MPQYKSTQLRTTGQQARSMQTVRGRGLVEITTDSINAIEEYVRWAERVPGRLPTAMDILCRFMALTNLGIAQEMSYGAYDPQNRNPSQAWRIPVRRISQRYFYGWKVKRVGFGVWMLYNDSREAYYIEYGIHRQPGSEAVSSRRIRRPIRKLSLRRTLEAMMRTTAYHRVWAEIFVDRHAKVTRGFSQTVQSPAGGHSMFQAFGSAAISTGGGSYTGPALGRRLP